MGRVLVMLRRRWRRRERKVILIERVHGIP